LKGEGKKKYHQEKEGKEKKEENQRWEPLGGVEPETRKGRRGRG